MCVLSQNIINEKIYLAFWWWFAILAVVASYAVLSRLFSLTVAGYRMWSIENKVNFDVWKSRSDSVKKEFRRTFYRHFHSCFCTKIGDWFMLNQIGKNVDSYYFTLFVQALWAELKYQDERQGLEVEKQPLRGYDEEEGLQSSEETQHITETA